MRVRRFPNLFALRADDIVEQELVAAGIPAKRLPDIFRSRGAIRTVVYGELYGWTFRRADCYWVCRGPGIPLAAAERLHVAYGDVVRAGGHTAGASPRDLYKGLGCDLYHVDAPEGLRALADTIKRLVLPEFREDLSTSSVQVAA